MSSVKVAAVILAAGEGTRMKSSLPKVLHGVCGRPMIDRVIEPVRKAGASRVLLVVGNESELVRKHLGDSVEYVEQKDRRGTGHALLQCRPALKDWDGLVLVTCGDMPLVTAESYAKIIQKCVDSDAKAVVTTVSFDNPPAYGRIIRDASGKIRRIVEQRDATEAEREVQEVNVGVYCFSSPAILDRLVALKSDNDQNELYLTDLVEMLVSEGDSVKSITLSDPTEALGINSRKELAVISAHLQRKVLERFMDCGVTIVDPAATYISDTVSIGRDTIINPGTIIEGATVIGEQCVIGPHSYIKDCRIGNGVSVTFSHLDGAEVADEARIGPFARLRPEARIGSRTKVGNFVEVKKSVIGPDSSAAHLSYIGDAEIGSHVNVGAGTITANYDGVRKHKTVIEDDANIGSGTVLVAPVRVGKGAVTGAGAVVTRNRDVMPGEVVVGVPAMPLKAKREIKKRGRGGRSA